MPKVQRKDIPRPLFAHLLQRIQERSIDAKALESLAAWLDTQPEVPEGEWFKRFATVTVCGQGPLVKTFLTPSQVPFGQELK
jgi:hypothetical protein